MIEGVPCTHILGLVIYDLPGRDCGGDASSGEFETGELSRYKAEYIDRTLFMLHKTIQFIRLLLISWFSSSPRGFPSQSKCSHCSHS
jgi:cellulase/cellobiase CelA1